MAAQIQRVEEKIDLGQTLITVGPAKHLGQRSLSAWLRANRNRRISFRLSERTTRLGQRQRGEGAGRGAVVALGFGVPAVGGGHAGTEQAVRASRCVGHDGAEGDGECEFVFAAVADAEGYGCDHGTGDGDGGGCRDADLAGDRFQRLRGDGGGDRFGRRADGADFPRRLSTRGRRRTRS